MNARFRLKTCAEPGCENRVDSKFCSKHFYVDKARREERDAVVAYLRANDGGRFADAIALGEHASTATRRTA